jgi:hypothetical protein
VARTTSSASSLKGFLTGLHDPAEGLVYWVGEAMEAIDFEDKDPTPQATATAARTLARLKAHAYPAR